MEVNSFVRPHIGQLLDELQSASRKLQEGPEGELRSMKATAHDMQVSWGGQEPIVRSFQILAVCELTYLDVSKCCFADSAGLHQPLGSEEHRTVRHELGCTGRHWQHVKVMAYNDCCR